MFWCKRQKASASEIVGAGAGAGAGAGRGVGAGTGLGGHDAGTPGSAGGGVGSPSEGDAWFDRLQAGQVATDLRSPTPVRDALQRSWLARLARECAGSSAWVLAAALAQPGLHPKAALARALRVTLEDELPALGLGPGCDLALDRMLPPLVAVEGARLRRALRRSLRHLAPAPAVLGGLGGSGRRAGGSCSAAREALLPSQQQVHKASNVGEEGRRSRPAGLEGETLAPPGAALCGCSPAGRAAGAAHAAGTGGSLPSSPRGILQHLHGVSRDCLSSCHWVYLATEVQPDLDARMALATALRAELDEEISAGHAEKYTQVAAVLENLPPLEPTKAASLRDALRLRVRHISLLDSEMDGGLSGRCFLLHSELEVMRRWMIWELPLRGNAADWRQLATCATLRAMNDAISVDPSGSKTKLLAELARHTYHTVPPYYRRALLQDPGDASVLENPSCDLLHRREAVLGLPPLCTGCVAECCQFCVGWDTRRRQWDALQAPDAGQACRALARARPLRHISLNTESPTREAGSLAQKRSHGECLEMTESDKRVKKRAPLKTLSFDA